MANAVFSSVKKLSLAPMLGPKLRVNWLLLQTARKVGLDPNSRKSSFGKD